MELKTMSSILSRNEREITLVQGEDEFYILSDAAMPKRETIGSRLYKRRLELGLSLAQVREKIYDDFKFAMGETTIRVLESDKVPNPGVRTLEFLALGLGLDPLEVIGLGLDDSPETESGFKESQFARLWQNYKKLDKEQKAFIDESVEMLITKIDKWR